ncbi:winged helix-turn-helix domain-containing protein [Catenuloplanes indicus]|uniref:DNA-binding FadR family transcriptional regulator n=1 Tax=Catenuloplanes indicus TaxID=137267 RepID=A0AAE4AWQ1_9ACTN|nr:winged helix-turn-helix domain-containing protein [Catenuloplanes indicus]MDQ0363423.1 DNA-binding FadR family transcriptional regulator [Catenuloplanes indicus]
MTLPGRGPRGYRELAEHLARQIRDGIYPAGQRLPSELALQQTYDLARNTVRKAVEELEYQGLVVVQRGYGAVVAIEQEKQRVIVPAGTVVSGRMPTLTEAYEWGLPRGIPMLIATGPDGTVIQALPADRFEIVTE